MKLRISGEIGLPDCKVSCKCVSKPGNTFQFKVYCEAGDITAWQPGASTTFLLERVCIVKKLGCCIKNLNRTWYFANRFWHILNWKHFKENIFHVLSHQIGWGEIHHLAIHNCMKGINAWAQEHFVKLLSINSLIANDCILILFAFYTASQSGLCLIISLLEPIIK